MQDVHRHSALRERAAFIVRTFHRALHLRVIHLFGRLAECDFWAGKVGAIAVQHRCRTRTLRRLIADIDPFAVLQRAGEQGFGIRCGGRMNGSKGKDGGECGFLHSIVPFIRLKICAGCF